MKNNPINNFVIKIFHLLQKITDTMYSKKYCFLFGCKNVLFKRKVNFFIGAQYFSIESGTRFGRCAVLTAWDAFGKDSFNPKIKIGNNCNFGDYVHITCINEIIIGNYVLTGRWVTISDNNHGKTDYNSLAIPPIKRPLVSKGSIQIGDNVWIGDKVTILANVKIGEGAVIAANSVVTKNVPPYSIAAGNPAKILK